MNQTIRGKEILGGYALATATLCVGFYLVTEHGDLGLSPAPFENTGAIVIRSFMLLAAAIVLKFTLDWGRLRGFAVGRADGTINLTNLARNLVVAVIVFGGIFFVSAPIAGVLTNVAR